MHREYLFYPSVLVFCSLPFFWEAALNRLKTQSGSNGFKIVKHATETSKFIPMSLRFPLSSVFFLKLQSICKKKQSGSHGLKRVQTSSHGSGNTNFTRVFLFSSSSHFVLETALNRLKIQSRVKWIQNS